MSYNENNVGEVANILENFDEDNIKSVFEEQILGEDSFISIPINHFQPLYVIYLRAYTDKTISDTESYDIRTKFENVCISIIDMINTKFSLGIDFKWIGDNNKKLPAITMALYQFFVLDIFSNILEIQNNYISNNVKDLSEMFIDSDPNKDVSTINNFKKLKPEYAIIANNINDITNYAFTMLDTENIFNYLTPTYPAAQILKRICEQNFANGDFIHSISELYKNNLALKSKITFELIYKINELGYLTNTIIERPAEIQE